MKKTRTTRVTGAVRLYLLLIWLTGSFHTIAISRGSSLEDIEITYRLTSPYVPAAIRHPLDVSKLLYNQLNKLNACDVLKLRGVASTHRNQTRKEAVRSMSRFEALVFVTIVSFVQVLRSLAVLISDKLLRSGDVESNPGPTPPCSPEPQPQANGDLASFSIAGSPDQQFPQAAEEVDMSLSTEAGQSVDDLSSSSIGVNLTDPVHGKTTPIPSTLDPPEAPTLRKVHVGLVAPEIPSIAKPLGDHKPQPFSKQEDEISITDSDVKYPIAQLAHKFPHQEEQKERDNTSLLVPTFHKEPEKEDESDFVGTRDFRELRRTGSCIKFEEFKESHRKRIHETLGRRHSITNLHSLERWIMFLEDANRLLRVGADCEYCPMCCKSKTGKVDSHIFPRGLLTVFKRIHCSNEKKKSEDFIYDFSRGVRMGPRAVHYLMLCDVCEKLCDEQSLRALYIFLMDNPDENSFKVPNDGSWLQRVLANIMFRGLLISDSLPEDLQDLNFRQTFKNLWNYCKSRDTTSEMPALYLFLLPNRPMDEELIMFLYPFEYVLRCPMFAKVFRNKELGISFIYTKFDCFHLILPLNSKSRDYFDRFQNGFDTYDDHLGQKCVDLRWTVPCVCDRKFDKETKAVTYCIPKEIQPLVFPEILLRIGLKQYGWCVSLIYGRSKKSQLSPQSKIMLEYLPGLNHEYPTENFRGDVEGIPHKARQPHQCVTFNKAVPEKELSVMIANAAKRSPLGLQQRKLDELSEENRRKTEELALQKKKIDEQSDDLKRMKRDLFHFQESLNSSENRFNIERRERLSLEKDLTQRDHDLLFVENQVLIYQQRLEVVHSLLYKERRELNRCKLEKAEQTKQSKTVERNLYVALETMSADLEKLREQTGSTLCNKLLHRCEQMRAIIDQTNSD